MKTAINLLLLSIICCICCVAFVNAQSYGGRATSINSAITVNGSTSTVLNADTGQLPLSGGNISISAPSTTIPNVLVTGTVSSNVTGFLKSTVSTSTVNDLDIVLPGVRIRANRIVANANCICCPGAGDPTCFANVQIAGLTLTDSAGNQTVVAVNGEANQVVNLPNNLGTITINEQASALGSVSVNGVHIRATQGTTVFNIIAASATAQIQCVTVAPVAAEVKISGKVLSSGGKPVGGVTVTLSDSAGNVRTTSTASNGTYAFEAVEVGQSYIIQASRAGYRFDSVVLDLTDEAVVDFRALPQ